MILKGNIIIIIFYFFLGGWGLYRRVLLYRELKIFLRTVLHCSFSAPGFPSIIPFFIQGSRTATGIDILTITFEKNYQSIISLTFTLYLMTSAGCLLSIFGGFSINMLAP